jgi:hypothetical protein
MGTGALPVSSVFVVEAETAGKPDDKLRTTDCNAAIEKEAPKLDLIDDVVLQSKIQQ